MTDVRRPVLDATPRQPEIELQIEPVDASPGQPTTARCDLTNTGSSSASYTLSVIGFEDGWVEVPAVIGPVAAGTSIQLALKINVPDGYPAATIVGVVSCGPVGAEPTVSADLAITVGDANQVYAALEPEESVGWRGARIAVVLRNRGANPTRVELSSVVPEKRLRVRFSHRTQVLPPGKELRVRAEVRALHHLTGSPRRRPFGVRVQGRAAPVMLDGAFVQRPVLSSKVMKLVALVAVAALWITAAVFGIGALSNHLQKNATSKAVASAPPIAPPVAPKSGSSSNIAVSGPHGSAPGKLGSGTVRVGGKVSGASPSGVLVTVTPTSLADPSTDGAVPVSTNATLTSAVTSNAPLPPDVPDGKVYGTMLGATVDAGLTADAGQPSIGTKTGPDGTWAIAGLQAPATYLVTFSKPGYSTQKYLLTTTIGGTAMTVNATINPGVGYISGTIKGPLGGLGGVQVTLTDGTVTLSTLTPSVGSNIGSWALSGLTTPDTYLVTATKAGYGTETTVVSLQASGTATGVTLNLKPGVGSISGTVVSDAGAVGIGGVTVTASNGSTTESATTTTVGKVGSYLLPNLPIPGKYALTVSGNGFVTQTRKVDLTGNAVVGASLTSAGADVLGFAYAKGKVGLGAAGVTLTNGTVTFKTLTQSTTPVGSFDFSQVPAGVYVLTVSDYGYAPASAQVIVSPGQVTTKSLILSTQAAASVNTGTVQGTVVDLFDAKGLTGVPVTLDGGTGATSGTNGTYQINDVAPGVHTLSASAPGFESASVQVNVPLGGVAFAPQLSLPKLDGISGTVTSATGTGAVSGATVTLYSSTATIPPQAPSAVTTTTSLTGTATTTTLTGTATTTTLPPSGTGATSGSATTNTSGNYTLPNLEHGSYQLLVTSPGYVSQTLDVSLAPDQSLTENVTLSLVPDFNVIVYAASGATGNAQVAGVCVTVTGNGYSSTQLSSATGAITFSPLVAGDTYTASFWQPSSTAGGSAVTGVPGSPCPQDNAEAGTAPSYSFVAGYNNTSIYSTFVASQLPAISVSLTFQYQTPGADGVATTVDCPAVTVTGAPSSPAGCPLLGTVPTVSLTGITGFGASSSGSLGNPVYSSAITATSPSGTTSDTWTFAASSLSALVSGQVTIDVNGTGTPLESISPGENYTGSGGGDYSFILTPTPVKMSGTVTPTSGVTVVVNPDDIPVSSADNDVNPGSVTASDSSGSLIWADSQVGGTALAQPGEYELTATATGYEPATATLTVGVTAGVLTGAASSATLTLTAATTLTVSTNWTQLADDFSSNLPTTLSAPTVYLLYDDQLVSSTNGGAVTVKNSAGTTTNASSLQLSGSSDSATFQYLSPILEAQAMTAGKDGYTVAVTAPGYRTYFDQLCASTSCALSQTMSVNASLSQEAVITGTVNGVIPDPALGSSGYPSSGLVGVGVEADVASDGSCSPPTDLPSPPPTYSDLDPSSATSTSTSGGDFAIAATPGVPGTSGAELNGGFCSGATYSVSVPSTPNGYSSATPATTNALSTTEDDAEESNNSVQLNLNANPMVQQFDITATAGTFSAGNPTISVFSGINAFYTCQEGVTGGSAPADCATATGANNFALNVYPTTYTYTVSAPGYASVDLSGISYAAGDTDISPITVQLEPTTQTITGTVDVQAGLTAVPAGAGLRIDLYNAGTGILAGSALTDASGKYTINSVPDGTYYAEPDSATGYEDTSVTNFTASFPAASTTQNITVEAPETTLSVSLTSAGTTPSLTGTSLQLTPGGSASSCLQAGGEPLAATGLGSVQSTTVAGDSAQFTNVEPDNYTLQASNTYLPTQTVADIEICPTTLSPSGASTTITVTFPTATVSGLSATDGPTSGSTSVTITGSGFTYASAVDFGSSAATFSVTSDTSISATSPSGSGTVDVTVATPGHVSATSPADEFTYVSAPTVTGISPTSGPTTGGTTVQLTGSSFTAATGVNFGSTAGTNFHVVSDTSISVQTPAEASGAVSVQVQSPGGNVDAPSQFTFVSPPTVTGISPTSGPTTGGTTVYLTGTAFTAATGVNFGSTAGTNFQVLSDTSISVQAPAEASGAVSVQVQSPGGNVDAPSQFTFGSSPSISSLSTTTGSNAGGTTVVITGSGFTGATGVKFGADDGTSFNVVSDTSISVLTPAEPDGSVTVEVLSPYGNVSAASQFTFGDPPTVSDLTATAGTGGSWNIDLTGTALTGASSATFDGLVVSNISVTSDGTVLTGTVPSQPPNGNFHVTVTTPYGTTTDDFTKNFS